MQLLFIVTGRWTQRTTQRSAVFLLGACGGLALRLFGVRSSCVFSVEPKKQPSSVYAQEAPWTTPHSIKRLSESERAGGEQRKAEVRASARQQQLGLRRPRARSRHRVRSGLSSEASVSIDMSMDTVQFVGRWLQV